MARVVKPLTSAKVSGAKPKEDVNYKLMDGKGFYLLVTKAGTKLWKLKYKFSNKEFTINIGGYPALSLKDARIERDKYRAMIDKGINPVADAQAKKEAEKQKEELSVNTFEKVANDYLEQQNKLNESYKTRLENAFENDTFPYLRDIPITEVTAKQIIDIVKRVEKRGAIESSHRLFTQIGRVFKYAVSNQIAGRNPCNDMDKNMILKSPTKKNYPTITDGKQIGILLNTIDDYTGGFTTKMALKLLPYVFVRPFNIRHAEWSEIDFEGRTWKIPGEKMKTNKELIIPLTDTTISILKEVYQLTYDAKYIFHSLRSKQHPMSDATLIGALRRMGYAKEDIVPHGFRAMFSTIAHEKKFANHDAIETQLAHSVGTSTSQAYNRALYLDERKELMQKWSDYLDGVKEQK